MKDVNVKVFVEIQSGRYDLSIGTYDIAPFEIGKYPVTNRWFKEFIIDDGYERDDRWSGYGFRWLIEKEPKYPRYWHNDTWNSPYYPVVGVCWYEAEAFCRWLTHTQSDGYTYRLPTEIEWEAAAAGFEKRVYPWGDEWDESRCNTKEAGIGKISEVGIFESGNTPEGICDMAGNVWEWTENSTQDNSHSVLRGGSWIVNVNVARCGFRNWSDPSFWNFNVGFRCVRTKD